MRLGRPLSSDMHQTGTDSFLKCDHMLIRQLVLGRTDGRVPLNDSCNAFATILYHLAWTYMKAEIDRSSFRVCRTLFFLL